jgi:predicted transcriptional regulator
MTERNTAKIKRSEDSKPARKSAGESGLANEVQRLKAELAAAEQRIAELEMRQTEVINRIDWAIDALHSLRASR